MAKRNGSRLPSNFAKQSGKTPGNTIGWDKSKTPSGDMARQKLDDRYKAFTGDKRTADLASRHNRMLTGKDRDALERVLHDPHAAKSLKDAARDALREDAHVKKLVDGAFRQHGWDKHRGHHGWDPWHHHPRHQPFMWGGAYVEPIDFGGLFGGIATLVSIGLGGGGVVALPPPIIEDGYAIFEPVGVVAPGVINATNFGGYHGVYYSVQDPVDPYAGEAVAGPGVTVAGTAPGSGSADMSYTDTASVGPTSIVFRSRYLFLGNSSQEKVTIHVQYLTQDEEGNWVWLPNRPSSSQESASDHLRHHLGATQLCALADGTPESISFELEPGQYGYAFDGDWKIHACRVRVWAESCSGVVWDKYKSNDFLLVAETDEEDSPTYVAPEMGTVKWIVR
jgi:hypothetical protein